MSQGYQAVNPFLFVDGAQRLIDFLGEAFGAVETERITRPDGAIGHAELRIGESVIMLSDATVELPAGRCAHYVYVDDVDRVYERALAAGGSALRQPANQFYGNREAGIRDPLGNIWWIATVIEEVPAGELQRRFEESRPEPGGGFA